VAKITKKQIPSKYFPFFLSKLHFGAWPQH